uniref:18S rRNA (Guanine-N(7))-methyltransferase n=1 Tax=Panagrellus redivivus TaxID=6233 RepID=A0A7E5A1T0_PANRE
MSRPEHSGPPELFYNETESRKYSSNSHIIQIQYEMSQRALELLALPEGEKCLLLDVGCGSGLSGEILGDNGHTWVGMDISQDMLNVAKEDNDCDGELVLQDMGAGCPFRPGVFDGAISISALQWLCHANSKKENPKQRLLQFFQTLYGCLSRGSRAVFQFYPENTDQSEFIMAQANQAGFNGGLVVDFPNSAKAKKVYLVLMTGGMQRLPSAILHEGQNHDAVTNSERTRWNKGGPRNAKPQKGSRAWIEAKKGRMERQGKEVRPTTKYTGRRRKHAI